MDPNPCATSEESELKEFNDPFEVVSESFVRRRHSEIDSKPLSTEDEQLLASLIDAGGIEDSILTDAFTKLVSMQYVPKEIAVQVQEGFEFEKARIVNFASSNRHKASILKMKIMETTYRNHISSMNIG